MEAVSPYLLVSVSHGYAETLLMTGSLGIEMEWRCVVSRCEVGAACSISKVPLKRTPSSIESMGVVTPPLIIAGARNFILSLA